MELLLELEEEEEGVMDHNTFILLMQVMHMQDKEVLQEMATLLNQVTVVVVAVVLEEVEQITLVVVAVQEQLLYTLRFHPKIIILLK
jgi:hypothetical protein